ncbi:MAG TPA: hypothetical protein VE378_06580 [Nitrososphaeraceae archaeon]|nr:hypothetical protein [Nitrososphaeraceae archaeon]
MDDDNRRHKYLIDEKEWIKRSPFSFSIILFLKDHTELRNKAA